VIGGTAEVQVRDPCTLTRNSVDFIIYTIGTIGVHFMFSIIGQIIAVKSAGPVTTPMQ